MNAGKIKKNQGRIAMNRIISNRILFLKEIIKSKTVV